MTTILHPSRQAALETHLVGRDAELARARALLAESRPVAVAGGEGVGKSALLRAAGASRGRPAFAGVCLGSLAWMPLLPLSHALGHEIARDDPDAVAAAIAREIGDGTLLIDALHAADPDTLDVVARLAGRVALAVAHRTPADPQLAGLLERAGFSTIPLEPLEHEQAARLAALLPPAPRAGAHRCARRAGRRASRACVVELANEHRARALRGRRRALARRARAARPAAARDARGGRARPRHARPRDRAARPALDRAPA